MRLNGRHGTSAATETISESRDEFASSSGVDDMMETENESLRERVAYLEKKVLEQGDEIVCLRSTLADVLRRLNQFDSRGGGDYIRSGVPVRNGNVVSSKPVNQSNRVGAVVNQSNRVGAGKDSPGSAFRLRPTTYQQQAGTTDGTLKDSLRRTLSCASSSLPQRRVVHYQSTGSLHSDSPSSTSVSPVPTSPSPTHTPPPPPPPLGSRSTPSPSTPQPPQQRPSSVVYNSGTLHKRWSSTGDFNNSGITSPTSTVIISNSVAVASRLATKSLFNLHMRPQQLQQNLLKHGTRDATFNEEEGTVRYFLRGRPIVLHAPTAIAENYDVMKVATAPQTRLKLEWVYGYRGRDCRSNLYLLPTGEMVYFVAAVVVLYNVEEQSQRHYLGHTDDVKCLTVHPNKLLVATGQAAGHDRREGRSWKFNPPPDRMAPEAEQWPHVRVWNSVSLHTLAIIGIGEFERSICCLSFSKADGGVLLCAVDEAPDHNISIWEWQRGERGQKITETKCSADTVVAAEFHPMDRQSIVTCGKSHISFWTLDASGMLYKRMGLFENRDKPKYVTCLAFTQSGDIVSGDSNGSIIVWDRATNTVRKFLRGLHEGSVFSLCVRKEGNLVTGGGKDGRLVELDASLNPTGQEAHVPEHLGPIRVVAEGRGSQLLVGTTKNCILIGSLELGLTSVVLGHTDELWGLAIHPVLPQFLTAGHDRLIMLWDSLSHSVVWSKDVTEPVQSATFSVNGNVLIIGCTSGRWLVMDAETREVYSMHTDGSEPIQVVKFSPDGTLLALGSRDNNVYVYQVSEEARKYSRVGRCMQPERRHRRRATQVTLLGHSSFITHLDWSTDSQYIQSNSGDYELLFWNAGLCRQIPHSSQLRDVEWASNSCVLTFNTLGIWPEGADGTDVNHCERSHNGRLMATADDFGKVKLYSYPVIQPRSLCHTHGGHSSHVTNVSFLQDDSRLISTGGHDTSVMQWALS